MIRNLAKKLLPSFIVENIRYKKFKKKLQEELERHNRIDPPELERLRPELPFLSEIAFDDIAFGDQSEVVIGAELECCIDIIKKHTSIKGKSILIIGCGKADEIHRWIKEKPSKILALDYLDYSDYWKDINYPNVTIKQADIRNMDLNESFDFITSKAVLEHVNGLPDAFSDIVKPLKKGGYFWADFGPLFYTWGGAHAPLAYDHILLSEEDYLKKLEPLDAVAGKLYWGENLFSRLKYWEYIKCFEPELENTYIGVTISELGLKFKKEEPEKFNTLLKTHEERDLLLKSIFYLGLKK